DSPSHPYNFISNADELHYTKPNPHFYEELMARVGVEADEAIMVGDNFDDDIVPAAAAGLGTFWISEGHNGKPSTAHSTTPVEMQPDGTGTLADFARRVDEGWLSIPKDRPRTVSQVAPRMLGNVAALFGLAESAKVEYWDMRPDPNEWSPLEIVCHLRDSERLIQRPRLQRIASEDNPFISEPVPPPGPRERDLSGEDAHTALRQFWEERCATLEFLMTLTPEQWQAPARHSVFGPTTLLEMAHFSSRHDHLHINQLCQTLGRCKQEVRAR
ncbi:MAG TPA: HAD-IA family hydrolase, partial [Aggregatilineales bacterium]|nr:HAD-IA family hydrolase [Aggregatilineales bacterium]